MIIAITWDESGFVEENMIKPYLFSNIKVEKKNYWQEEFLIKHEIFKNGSKHKNKISSYVYIPVEKKPLIDSDVCRVLQKKIFLVLENNKFFDEIEFLILNFYFNDDFFVDLNYDFNNENFLKMLNSENKDSFYQYQKSLKEIQDGDTLHMGNIIDGVFYHKFEYLKSFSKIKKQLKLSN